MLIDFDKVSSLIEEVADTLVVPRYARLNDREIEVKSNPEGLEDIVTVVDREVEAALTHRLQSSCFSAPVIGEEAAHGKPRLLDLLSYDGPLWIIDPIDGTRNFAGGKPGFGVMVAFVVDGITEGAWIVLPILHETYVAEKDAGTCLNRNRIKVPPVPREAPLRGSILSRYMPTELQRAVKASLASAVQEVDPSGCAATEYTDILRGSREFVVYYRLLPWDHAAPALVLSEAGGCAKHASGSLYTVRSPHQLTIVARNAEISERLHACVQRSNSG